MRLFAFIFFQLFIISCFTVHDDPDMKSNSRTNRGRNIPTRPTQDQKIPEKKDSGRRSYNQIPDGTKTSYFENGQKKLEGLFKENEQKFRFESDGMN